MSDDVGAEIAELADLQQGWREKLIAKGVLANVITALRHAPEWDGVTAFNAFACRTEAIAPPPWASNAWTPGPWEDTDDTRAADWSSTMAFSRRQIPWRRPYKLYRMIAPSIRCATIGGSA